MKKTMLMIGGAAVAATLFANEPVRAETELKAVAGINTRSVVTQVFIKFVEATNAKGAGKVKINYLGSSEITPVFQQAKALGRGLFDVMYTPAAFYAGQVKEVDALLASNVPIQKMRENGAMDELARLWRAQLGAHLLGWFDTHVFFNLFLGKNGKYNEPKSVDDLKNMLKGNKIWSTPTFRELVVAVGGTPVARPPTEILPSLDKGVVDGYGFPEYGMIGFGLQRATAARINPTYYRGNTMALVNAKKWDGLPADVKDFLTKEARAYEISSSKFIRDSVKKDLGILAQNGMKEINLPPEIGRKYREIAHNIAWDRLAKRSPNEVGKLRQLMYDPALQ